MAKKEKLKKWTWLVISFLLVVYGLLAFKDPYSMRSLIPNLEPAPDSFYYGVPPWNFAMGKGYKMMAFGKEIMYAVPSIYGAYMVPFFWLFKDFRAFYFGNLLLAFMAIIVFIKSIDCLVNDKKHRYLYLLTFGFIFITNYYFYLQPTLMMAENMSLLVVVCAVYLLVKKVSKRNIFLSLFVGLCFWLVKFSNLPLGFAFYFGYWLKVWQEYGFKKSLRYFLVPIAGWSFFWLFLKSVNMVDRSKSIASNTQDFSIKYLINNLTYYLGVLFGTGGRYLWYGEFFTNRILPFFSIAGIFFGLWQKKYRIVTLGMVSLIGGLLLFMGIFFFTDIRYVYSLWPTMLVLALIVVVKFENQKEVWLLLILLGSVLLSQTGGDSKTIKLISLKRQVGLNLRHAEVPWNYMAVKSFDDYFVNKDNNTYFATFLTPFYLDIFGNKNYNYLPLSSSQEFTYDVKDIMKYFYSGNLVEYYGKLIKDGKKVYFSDYYITANRRMWQSSLDEINKTYTVIKVHDGCENLCNIYEITLKTKK